MSGKSAKATARPIDAIVIGCSAGGLNALHKLLDKLPAKLGAGVVIVSHAGPEGPNLLPQLLASECPLPASEAIEREAIRPNHIYIAPPNYHLLIERDRTFSLSVDPRVCFVRPSIDVLFTSAADAYQQQLLGIILTGANRDGAEGVKAIRQQGGTVLVQDPVTAHADTMPLAAIATGVVDRVLPLDEMASAIVNLCRTGRRR